MYRHYQALDIIQLKDELIALNEEFILRLKSNEGWKELSTLRNEIRKVEQIIDLKIDF